MSHREKQLQSSKGRLTPTLFPEPREQEGNAMKHLTCERKSARTSLAVPDPSKVKEKQRLFLIAEK